MGIWFLIAALIIILDQAVKYVIMHSLEVGELIKIINGFFYITYVRNKGAAWSILENQRVFFIIITTIVSLVIAYELAKSKDRVLRTSFSFILGGAIGNLIDRVRLGSVTDFLEFHFGTYIFPIFNIADSFVVVGTFLLAIYLLFIQKDEVEKE